MPVFFDAESDGGLHPTRDRCITIGLVNNMSDEALRTTERQFFSLLNAASEGVPVRLLLYTLPGIARGEAMGRHIRGLYSNIDDLWDGQLDGLIVTGREPLAARLVDEPYWESFTRLLAWARENAHATIWSCLAAHAAILHMDGIERVKREAKLFGIFDCAQASQHALTAHTPASIRLPHSRWNGIPEAVLTDCGYKVLTRGTEAGVDTFFKQEKKLFLFFQGHPEYSSDTLLREYRRDLGRYFRGESDQYPGMPAHYFDAATTRSLSAFEAEAMVTRDPSMLTAIGAELEKSVIANTWDLSATAIYKNWLQYLRTEKEAGQRSKGKLVPALEAVS
jgi:homoserine O-succinyltransferase